MHKLTRIANQLRILSIQATTAAGSGHPTSCCSAADIVAALFFGHMKYDPKNPKNENNDRFILSKGHAAPLLYSAWAMAGHIPFGELTTLRKLNSPLEGHPTPRLDFVDVATGSLGQGLSAGIGMALKARMDQLSFRTFVLMGDGEISEGSVWEAASFAALQKLTRLTAIVDVNYFGQSQKTAFGYDLDVYAKRFEAFGWKAVQVDGHNIQQTLDALNLPDDSRGRPLAIIAKTVKGKGISGIEGKPDWHGKTLSKEQAEAAILELSKNALDSVQPPVAPPEKLNSKSYTLSPSSSPQSSPNYTKGEEVATRKAFGNALARLGETHPNLVALDGDVENSTYTNTFAKKFPDRFVECFISEQNMVGVATGLSALGKTAVAATFGAFLSRAMDQIRVAGISGSSIKLVGSHVGISIGEDGPTQMALEDMAAMRAIPNSVVLAPCDAISAERLTEKMIDTSGLIYMRTGRPEEPIIYSTSEEFEIGGAKILKQTDKDSVCVVACGVPVFEAIQAEKSLAQEGIHITVIDAYSVKPLARDVLLSAFKKTNLQVITVEDHYSEGGLGDAVAGEFSKDGVKVHKLAVNGLPRSGKKDELLSLFSIDSKAIQKQVKKILQNAKAH